MFDLGNMQLITTLTIPEGDIVDNKSIVYAETPIPGANFQPIVPGGNGNRKVSFSIPLVRRNGVYGTILLLKQFDALRNHSEGFLSLKSRQFTPNPKVLYYWGVGSIPLEWYVTKCNMRHSAGMVSVVGFPQYSVVDIELMLDETSPLYMAEKAFRSYAGDIAQLESAAELIGVRSHLGIPM
jgi:hypothetical protein